MQEKEHAASEGQRQKFAGRGELPRSQDLTRLAVLVGGGAALLLLSGFSIGHLVRFTASTIGDSSRPLSVVTLLGFGSTYARAVGPALLGALVFGLAVGLAQTQGRVSKEALQLKLDKLNPLPGLKRMFLSFETLISLLMSSGKVGILAVVCGWTLVQGIPSLLGPGFSSLARVLAAGGDFLVTLLVRASLTMLVLAVVDFAVNWIKLERKMKMSTQELKDENKEQNGDPLLKAQRRSRHKELVEQRSIQNVPQADVVLVNPTHFAVALAYSSDADRAPRVVAKGADRTAARIRALARSAGVPIVSQPPLARLLYKTVKVGKTIPAELFQAVASVLAYVYRRRRAAA